MLLAGLWFGSKKPLMNTFLKPFVDQMNVLSSTGFLWTDSQRMHHRVRVFTGPCSVDTVARAMVMNMNQFNNCHGCGWCVHGGEVVRRGNSHARVYPLLPSHPAARTHQSFLDCAGEAEEANEPKLGVRGQSVLFLLAFFFFPVGFVVATCMLCALALSGTQHACGLTTKHPSHTVWVLDWMRSMASQ